MKQKFFKFSKAVTTLAMAGLLGACSTEIITPEEGLEIYGDDIVLNFNPDDLPSTRAGSDHVLRYTAKLFQGEFGTNTNPTFLERKEIIATNGNNTITFSVPQGTYSVLIFADYIPANSSPDAIGLYPDKYYDTTSTDESVRMLAFTDKNGSTLLNQCCINNDNYDCFTGIISSIHKTEQKYEQSLTLQRATAKVRFISTTPLPDASITEIKLSSFDYRDTYFQFGESARLDGKTVSQMKLDNYTFSQMSDESNGEVFYFYTLASLSANNNLKKIEFTVKYSDGTSRKTTIDDYNIPIKKNHITTVKGAFLTEPLPDPSELGDITLHFSTGDWETPDISYQQ